MRGPLTEVASLIYEKGKSRLGRACLHELPNTDNVLGYAVGAPKYDRQLSRLFTIEGVVPVEVLGASVTG